MSVQNKTETRIISIQKNQLHFQKSTYFWIFFPVMMAEQEYLCLGNFVQVQKLAMRKHRACYSSSIAWIVLLPRIIFRKPPRVIVGQITSLLLAFFLFDALCLSCLVRSGKSVWPIANENIYISTFVVNRCKLLPRVFSEQRTPASVPCICISFLMIRINLLVHSNLLELKY